MYSIADEYGGIGLLKFDFLGLTNLTVLADSVARVKARLEVTVELDKITLDDKKVTRCSRAARRWASSRWPRAA